MCSIPSVFLVHPCRIPHRRTVGSRASVETEGCGATWADPGVNWGWTTSCCQRRGASVYWFVHCKIRGRISMVVDKLKVLTRFLKTLVREKRGNSRCLNQKLASFWLFFFLCAQGVALFAIKLVWRWISSSGIIILLIFKVLVKKENVNKLRQIVCMSL